MKQVSRPVQRARAPFLPVPRRCWWTALLGRAMNGLAPPASNQTTVVTCCRSPAAAPVGKVLGSPRSWPVVWRGAQLLRAEAMATTTVKPLLPVQTPVPSDIEIAQSIQPKHISQIAEAALELHPDEYELYGCHKAKVRPRAWALRGWGRRIALLHGRASVNQPTPPRLPAGAPVGA